MSFRILGLHHVTATVDDAQADLDFGIDALGLRLVKKTVNFDNRGVYHFYYGDERGSHGTLWTTFPYKLLGVPAGFKGAGQVTVTSFSVPAGSLDIWKKRLHEQGFTVTDAPPPGKSVDILASPDGQHARNGVGTVHHVAMAIGTDEEQLELRSALVKAGIHVTPVIDRSYFHSIYFREPGGVLFEVATVEPGFMTDEPLDQLGQGLKLPPWEEVNRADIEHHLPPVKY